MMYRLLVAALLFFIPCRAAFAQQVIIDDTVAPQQISNDTLRFKHHSVKRAVLQSAIIPGWGQVYNKKWWKVPIIYAGFGGLGFSLGWNTKRWKTYRDAYSLRVDGDTSTIDEFEGVYSDANLLTLKKFYRRNMDLAIIFTTVLYVLNIIDAAVDAHLFEYDISDDLSLRVEPVLRFSGSASPTFTGVAFSLQL